MNVYYNAKCLYSTAMGAWAPYQADLDYVIDEHNGKDLFSRATTVVERDPLKYVHLSTIVVAAAIFFTGGSAPGIILAVRYANGAIGLARVGLALKDVLMELPEGKDDESAEDRSRSSVKSNPSFGEVNENDRTEKVGNELDTMVVLGGIHRSARIQGIGDEFNSIVLLGDANRNLRIEKIDNELNPIDSSEPSPIDEEDSEANMESLFNEVMDNQVMKTAIHSLAMHSALGLFI